MAYDVGKVSFRAIGSGLSAYVGNEFLLKDTGSSDLLGYRMSNSMAAAIEVALASVIGEATGGYILPWVEQKAGIGMLGNATKMLGAPLIVGAAYHAIDMARTPRENNLLNNIAFGAASNLVGVRLANAVGY